MPTQQITSSTNNGSYIAFTESAWRVVNHDSELETSSGTKVKLEKGKGMPPKIFFQLMKRKLTILGTYRYEKRIKKLEKLAEDYLDKGHYALSEKFLNAISKEVKLAEITGAGIKMCLDKCIVDRYKHKVRGGKISDTRFECFTRVIPDDILARKKELDDLKIFDDYIIYHYWNDEIEAKKEKKEPVSSQERANMRDPILFGRCKEIPDMLFFIADWQDEYCDLTFSELVDKLELKDEDVEIPELGKDLI